jgi:cytochrome c551/c552
MTTSTWTYTILTVLLLGSMTSGLAAETVPGDVAAILGNRCGKCHGPEKQTAGLRFDQLSADFVGNRAAAERWHDALHAVQRGEMPPFGEPELTDAERERLTGWIDGQIEHATAAQRANGGLGALRRLNRVEYANTMRDLLGLSMDYARTLPPDPASADGFTNDGSALQMSALQLESYLEIARTALGRVIVSGPAPPVFEHEFTESKIRNGNRGELSNRLGRPQEFVVQIVDDYPDEGEFRIRLTVTPEFMPDQGPPLLEVAIGFRPDTQVVYGVVDVIEVTEPGEQTFEFRDRIENYPLPARGQGKYPGLLVRVRNLYDDGSPLPKRSKKDIQSQVDTDPHLPKLMVQSLNFRGPFFDVWPPETHRRILPESDLGNRDEKAYVREILGPFMTRAFRRPVSAEEVAGMVEFFAEVRPTYPTFEEAVRETLALVLVSPEFLYLVEPGNERPRSLSDWELASRLSYFLWSTMPDERLFELAAASQLTDTKTLAAEVDRMLDDPRSARFVEQFSDQWLRLGLVEQVAVNPEYYPGFDESLRQDMRGEAQAFFGELLRRDASALDLLSSDFVMVNSSLARHYGIEGVHGQAFRPVAAPEHRGGLLTQAAVLLANSTGEDSHPVLRAVWIRDRLLDDPPAPPPPDVPTLDEVDPSFHKLSVREQLAAHRDKAACNACHRGIDPWGVALEHFDAVGLWRDEVRRRVGKKFELSPVEAADILPDGHKVSGAEDLRDYLLAERSDDFARSLVKRMTTYALGRPLGLADAEAIDELCEEFADDGHRLRGLIRQVVTSEPFRTK